MVQIHFLTDNFELSYWQQIVVVGFNFLTQHCSVFINRIAQTSKPCIIFIFSSCFKLRRSSVNLMEKVLQHFGNRYTLQQFVFPIFLFYYYTSCIKWSQLSQICEVLLHSNMSFSRADYNFRVLPMILLYI